ncbi:MAG: hypothetical protein A3G18_10405 [Rhodospirillales bacterium RIFCSPLOWO2_12_FULL_58_28]|nr:MAG: hypothetical protein A3H92_08580 [Rhodospirillales bacterium RIFCSPLOWO2_02_FULL_58_16]OHC77687.1 MAG: hypothetical protein A3G18_10405 [Rhodospirillales bacterium RIFCSPLOWO2_12_FULL_58_28]
MNCADEKAVTNLDYVRRKMAVEFPSLLAKAAADYRTLASGAPECPKDFAARQAACKAALAHIEHLIKMTVWAEGTDPETKMRNENSTLIARAAVALNNHPEDEE